MLNKAIHWCCVAILIGFATVLSWDVVHAAIDGQVRSLLRYSDERVYIFAQNPVRFVLALAEHCMNAGFFWFLAYWAWREGNHLVDSVVAWTRK